MSFYRLDPNSKIYIGKITRVEAKAAINTEQKEARAGGSENARMSLCFEQVGVSETYVIRHFC